MLRCDICGERFLPSDCWWAHCCDGCRVNFSGLEPPPPATDAEREAAHQRYAATCQAALPRPGLTRRQAEARGAPAGEGQA